MVERRLVVTVSIGKAWERIAAVSHPTLAAYALTISIDATLVSGQTVSLVHGVSNVTVDEP